jgi:N-acetylneuraminic acid mutarotase
MKIFLIIFALNLLPKLLAAQSFGIWASGDTAGFTPRFSLTAQALDGKIYVMGGNEDGKIDGKTYQTNRFEVYDPISNSWHTPKTTGTFNPRQYLASASVRGRIYAIGGANGADLNYVDIFDPVYNTWSRGTGMPTARNALTASVIGNKIYAIGGANQKGWLNSLEVYDPETNSWSVPVTAGWFHPMSKMTASVVDDKIYIFGGYDGFTSLDSVFIFDPASNSWSSPLTSGKFTPRNELTSSVVNGKIYVFGGKDQGIPLNTVEVFDPATNSWDTVITKDSLVARYGLTSATIDRKMYVLGGTPDSDSTFNLNQIFTPTKSAVQSKNILTDVLITPNPTSGIITITGGNLKGIAISNMVGKRILEIPGFLNGRIDLSGFPSGCYSVAIKKENSVIMQKIIKE